MYTIIQQEFTKNLTKQDTNKSNSDYLNADDGEDADSVAVGHRKEGRFPATRVDGIDRFDRWRWCGWRDDQAR